MSIFFSIVGCSLLLSSVLLGLNRYIAYILFAGCVQCRLLCNLFDGMVAVEGGKRSPNGDLYNDMPDRFDEDTVGTGFDVILGVIDKIAAFQEENGFNGPQKK